MAKKKKEIKIPEEFIEEYNALCKELQQADADYYINNNPKLTDTEYDRKYYRIMKIEEYYPLIIKPDSPTQRVGGAVSSDFRKVSFSTPMLSLDKRNDTSVLVKDFINKFKLDNVEILCEHKLDGLTLVVTYENGMLSLAVTRGNGYEGEDVTHTARTIRNLPLSIPFKGHLVIRGEVIILKEDFEDINIGLEAHGYKPFATARNLASGSLRQIDPQVCASRRLMFVAYDIIETDFTVHEDFATNNEQLEWLRKFQHIPTIDYTVIKGEKQLLRYIEKQTKLLKSNKILYDIDGLVFKVNDISKRGKLGLNTKYPNWAMAFKFEDDVYETKLLDIEWNVSRTRRINPVAIIETVMIDGTEVSRATLNNPDFIAELQLGIGDTITVKKANQIIPNVVESLTASNSYSLPETCPECGEKVLRKGAYLYCSNKNCIGAMMYAFTHFTSKGAMDIKGLSYSKLHDLISNGYVKKFIDLYDISKYKREIISMEGWGHKSYMNLYSAIDKSRFIHMDRFLYALGIPLLGAQTAYDICNYVDYDFDKLLSITEFQLMHIDGIAEKTAHIIYKYLNSKKIINTINEFRLSEQIEFVDYEEAEAVSNKLEGYVICVTGSFEKLGNRDEIHDMIVANGGSFTDGIKKNTTHLLVGDKPGSKLAQAINKGLEVLYEKEFADLIK